MAGSGPLRSLRGAALVGSAGAGLRLDVFHHVGDQQPAATQLEELRQLMTTMQEAIDRVRASVERTEGRMASVIALCTEVAAIQRTIGEENDIPELLELADRLETEGAKMAAAVEAVPVRVRPGDQQPPREETNAAGFPVAGTSPTPGPVETPSPGAVAMGVTPPTPEPVAPVAPEPPVMPEPPAPEPVPVEPPSGTPEPPRQ